MKPNRTPLQDRLLKVQKYYKMNRETFAQAIGTSRTCIYTYLKGTQKDLPAIINVPIVFPEISCEWFFRGNGEMLNNVVPTPADGATISTPDLLVDCLSKEELLTLLSHKIEETQKQLAVYNQMILQTLAMK